MGIVRVNLPNGPLFDIGVGHKLTQVCFFEVEIRELSLHGNSADLHGGKDAPVGAKFIKVESFECVHRSFTFGLRLHVWVKASRQKSNVGRRSTTSNRGARPDEDDRQFNFRNDGDMTAIISLYGNY